MNHDKIDITLDLVKKLICDQFPQWSNLPIKEVIPQGHDNRTFRLGSEMSIRLPSDECYAPKVQIEQTWLPFLAANLSIQIPTPIAMGIPTNYYPWNWSIYKWLDGQSANNLSSQDLDMDLIALQLANFLNNLHKINTEGAPHAGPHNFFRGGNLSVYDCETHDAIKALHGVIDESSARDIWKKALSSKWNLKPVWIHGDLSAGNILIKNKELDAVIDFGGMSIGDPACDLVIAWIFLKNKSREIFKANLNLDEQTWERARGWALWKALITLEALKDNSGEEANKQHAIINSLIEENNWIS